MGRCGLVSSRASSAIDPGHRLGLCKVGHHDGERLVPPVLAQAQSIDRRVRPGVAREVVPAEALDGDDGAPCERLLSGTESGVGSFDEATLLLEPDAGTALGTGDRLGMEAAVGRIVILRRAGVAHGEPAHGRIRPVIGQAQGDGEAGTAVRAVDEGVARPAVGRVGHLGQAVVAHGDVGRDEGPCGALGGALDDAEAALVGGRALHCVDGEDLRQGRSLGDQPRPKALDGGGGPLHLHEHPFGVVSHVAGEPELRGEAVHEGPEPDPLDDADHPDPAAHRRSGGGHGGHAVSWLRRPRVTAASRCIRPKL